MAALTCISGFSALLGVAGVGLGAAALVLAQEIKAYAKKIDQAIKKNQKLLQFSTVFKERIKIISSPVLGVQQNKINLILMSNVEEIQLYYQHLQELMNNYDVEYYHSLMQSMPGSSQTVLQKTAQYSGYILYGLQIVFTVYNIYETYNLYTQWQQGRKVPLPASNIQMQRITQVKDPKSGYFSSRKLTLPNRSGYTKLGQSIAPIPRTNTAIFKSSCQNIFKVLGKFFSRNTFSFKNVFTAIGLLANIGGLVLVIINIRAEQDALKEMKKSYNDLLEKLGDFLSQCLGILKNLTQFFVTLEAQFFSFAALINYIQQICNHNNIVSKDPQRLASEISNLEMKQLNVNVFSAINRYKTQLIEVLDGLVITQSEKIETVNNVQTTTTIYKTTQSFDSISKRFEKATAIIVELDSQINITKIYDSFYSKLRMGQNLLKQLPLKNVKKLLNFTAQIKKAINKKEQLSNIEVYYRIRFDVDKLGENDRKKIAQIISFSTNVFPIDSNNTKVYSYELSQFKMKLDPKYLKAQTTQIQDIDMGSIMGSWPQDMKNLSIQSIIASYNTINQSQLQYTGSSLYIQNIGTSTQPNWQLSRIQVFQKSKPDSKRFYVFYDSITNKFVGVKTAPLKAFVNQTSNLKMIK